MRKIAKKKKKYEKRKIRKKKNRKKKNGKKKERKKKLMQINSTLAVVAGKGEVATDSFGSVSIFELLPSSPNSANFTVQQMQNSIPCISYPVQFNYTFSVNLYQGTILVVTQDSDLSSWGFDAFPTCPPGTGWSGALGKCNECPPGQHKLVPNQYNLTNVSNFDLCMPCKANTYNPYPMFCSESICPSNAFCPAGSPAPIFNSPKIVIGSIPSPVASEPLDFENTFYYSCYPYFVLFLTSLTAIAIPLCCTWPHKTNFQKQLVSKLLIVNFFYWPSGDEEEDFFMEEPKFSIINAGEEDYDQVKTQLETRRRMHIDKFLGSLCSYFFVATFTLMIIFGFVFTFHGENDSVEIDLMTLDQPTSLQNQTYLYQALNQIDQSSFQIVVLLVGYNGLCMPEEINFVTMGCYSLDMQEGCKFSMALNRTVYNDTGLSNCTVTASFQPSNFEQTAKFALHFNKLNFYAQMVIYNVSTTNNETWFFHGNAYLAGSFAPAQGNILRGNLQLGIMSILTFITDCHSYSPDKLFVPDLVRASLTNCTPNITSYKSLSFQSAETDEINLLNYNFLNSSGLTFNLVMTKSPFYKNVYQTYYVSFGTILNLIMFAALDVYWIVEAMCPWLGFLIFNLQNMFLAFRKTKK